MPYLRFNIDFKHQGVSFVYSNKLFKYEITIIVGNFETILSVNVTKEKRL